MHCSHMHMICFYSFLSLLGFILISNCSISAMSYEIRLIVHWDSATILQKICSHLCGGSQFGFSSAILACFYPRQPRIEGPSGEQDDTVDTGVLLVKLTVLTAWQGGNSWPVFYWDLWWRHCLWAKDLQPRYGVSACPDSLRCADKSLPKNTGPLNGPDSLRAVLFSSVEPT